MKVVNYLFISCALLSILILGGNYLYGIFEDDQFHASESIQETFPAPEAAPPARFESFNYRHPRLPHPTATDLARINTENPGFLNQHRKTALSGSGSLYSATLITYTEPTSLDLKPLLKRLLDMPFGHRGNNVKHLAVAYDWLYHQWNETQRQQLLLRVMEGCNTNIGVIREQQLSPYNVFLYNSPLQNLVYCALAVYGDSDQADPIMNFTYDLWTRRVLPVWRQIMGEHGGWHEGGEYVGIGIGQAVYQIPAAWRSATGEDYFKSESGIRGFLDFLIYRTRPDGAHFRWGDAGHFDKKSPDQFALAIEYKHKAAYTFLDPPNRLVPTAYPWGPLTNDSLIDPKAIESLPRIKLFDGIGLVVARSDWTEDALYVTFKAGNNYWSHSHLDQGAFTIYKNGALAIDSGLYGSSYGSDHHMNYTYQTIAHNTITVTDPNDTNSMPGRDAQRHIANDGGQRRVGSGWGINPAPLDLIEWQNNRQIFHTAAILGIDIKENKLLIRADLTPAYTNNLSGKGTFANRTKRVKRLIRTFALDLDNSAVIVFDELTKSKADYLERWLLHSIRQPENTQNEFIIPGPNVTNKSTPASTLWGKTLLPKSASIRQVGGPDFEYFVAGRNYDENGAVAKTQKRKPDSEPGTWRLEISDYKQNETARFLVLLQATANDENERTLKDIRLTAKKDQLLLTYLGGKGIVSWPFVASDR